MANAEAPNCIVGNIVLSPEMTTISDEAGRRAIIIFFN
jgi:hypothetical protein